MGWLKEDKEQLNSHHNWIYSYNLLQPWDEQLIVEHTVHPTCEGRRWVSERELIGRFSIVGVRDSQHFVENRIIFGADARFLSIQYYQII